MRSYNGQISHGWYEETEEDIEHRRLQNVAQLQLKQKLNEVFALSKSRSEERQNAIKEIKE